MTLTKIFSAMEKGPEAIDANFKALDANTITKNDWTETGITYLNGFGRNGDVPLKYTIIDLGNNTRMIGLSGWIKTGQINWNTTVVGIKIPTSIFKPGYNTWTGGTIFNWNNGVVTVNYSMKTSTGEIEFKNIDSPNNTTPIKAGSDFQIRSIFII